MSLNTTDSWLSGTNTARCLRPTCSALDDDGQLPHKHGTCGLYAYKTVEEALPEGSVLGSVLLWGKVIHHTKGYRGQYARVEALEIRIPVTNQLRDLVADYYKVPVTCLVPNVASLHSMDFSLGLAKQSSDKRPHWKPKRLLIILAVLAIWAGWTAFLHYFPYLSLTWGTAHLYPTVIFGGFLTLFVTPLFALLLYLPIRGLMALFRWAIGRNEIWE